MNRLLLSQYADIVKKLVAGGMSEEAAKREASINAARGAGACSLRGRFMSVKEAGKYPDGWHGSLEE